MQRRKLKSEIILAALALGLVFSSTTYAQNKRRDIRTSGGRSRAVGSNRPAEFQRDPIRVVTEFYLDEKTNDAPFDLSLTAERTLGPGGWEKLSEKQRSDVAKAFKAAVKDMLDDWDPDAKNQLRILKKDVNGDRATITVLRGLDLIRLSLSSRSGNWFITEQENLDEAFHLFSDAVRGALRPGTSRGRVLELSTEDALKRIDLLIAQDGERPELLLHKYTIMVSKQIEEQEANAKGSAKDPQSNTQNQSLREDRALELLEQITKRWPDFAPAHLALAFDLLYYGNDGAVLSTISKDAEKAIPSLQRYIELVPYDPRPWRDLAHAYALLEKNKEAEEAFQKAISLDPTYIDHYASLISFLLTSEQLEKAKESLRQMLKFAPAPEDAFDALFEEEGFDTDYAKSLENLLLAFPKEVESSKSGLLLFATVQEAQNKIAEAVKTMQRAVAIEAEANDFEYLSQLYRQQGRFTEALNAANQAHRLDSTSAGAHFERACSLAQLGRKREALAALKQIISSNPDSVFDPDEPDLKPLANLPEYKAIREKLDEILRSANEEKTTDKKMKSRKP